jgi:DNA-binding MarR family transcriptional regulator
MATAITIPLMRLLRQIHVRATDEVLGMKLKQVILLSHLRDARDEVPQQQLGDAIGLDANNLVLMLNDLEVEELVERRRDPADRRRHNVAITTPGRKRLERAEEQLAARDEEVLAALSAEERATLRALLGKALTAPLSR